jgi:leucyl/phenylalanyl-tRNA--protein transferase
VRNITQIGDKLYFPPSSNADEEGLLAYGGDLSVERLKMAYSKGIFPWYQEGYPVLWWTPNPRFVLYPQSFRVSKSLRQTIRNKGYRITINRNFKAVVEGCKSLPRKGQEGTWITSDLKVAYHRLHLMGIAHSIEVWLENDLAGGLYGLLYGDVFFGESMFTRERDASKVALYNLSKLMVNNGGKLIDCQVYTKHLKSLGAVHISRKEFEQELSMTAKNYNSDPWTNTLKFEVVT